MYPADHIGRSSGAARACAVHPDGVPPDWPWSLDNSPLGCNDFRATKRNVHWAIIGYPKGPGVLIHAEGRQHVRAMVESDRISIHVNDWYGGIGAGAWEWVGNYGKGRLVRRGDTLASTVHVQLVRQA